MDSLILIAAAILNPRARRRRAHKRSEQSTSQHVGTHPDHREASETNEKRTEFDE